MLKNRIKDEMNTLGISQKALGNGIGISQEAIQKILSGKTVEPKRIVEIAQFLKVSPIWLKTGIGGKNELGDLNQEAVSFALRVIKSIPIETQEHSGIEGMTSVFTKAYKLSIANDKEGDPVSVESFLDLIT